MAFLAKKGLDTPAQVPRLFVACEDVLVESCQSLAGLAGLARAERDHTGSRGTQGLPKETLQGGSKPTLREGRVGTDMGFENRMLEA